MPGLILNSQNRKEYRFILYWGKKIYNRYSCLRTAELMLGGIEESYGPFPVGHIHIFDVLENRIVRENK